MMIQIIVIAVILIFLIAMSIIGYQSFKGILDALESNRQQLERLLLAHEKQATALAQLVVDFSVVQRELKQAIEGVKTEIKQDLQREPLTTTHKSKLSESTNYVRQELNLRKASPVANTFYAKAYEYPDRIVVEAKDYADAASTVPFKVEVKGDKGKIIFNTASYVQIADNAKVLVLPFCDVNMETAGNPRAIENIKPGEVAMQNGEWIVTRKPSVKII